MKILEIHKYYSKKSGDGSVSAFFETIALLERRGNEVVVFSMQNTDNEPSPYDQYFTAHFDLRTMTFWQKFRHIPKVLYNREAAKKLDQLLTDQKPDIAHVHSIFHYLSPSIFPILKKHNIPIVFMLSDYHAICPNHKLFAHGKIDDTCRDKKFYKLFSNSSINNSRAESFVAMIEGYTNRLFRLYEYVDLFLAPSVFMQKICGEYGIPQDKIVVLRNVLDLNAYQRTFEKKKYILYMGRLSEEKGILTLLNAVQLLARQGKLDDFHCIIAGHGPQERELHAYVKNNDLNKYVHFVGFCSKETQQWSDLQKYASIMVLPSIWYDNSPIAISEAMAFGTPVIVSDRGGTKELIKEGKSGLLFQAGNIADLADKIEVLLSDESLSSQMRRHARERVTELNNEEKYYANLMMYFGMTIKNNKERLQSSVQKTSSTTESKLLLQKRAHNELRQTNQQRALLSNLYTKIFFNNSHIPKPGHKTPALLILITGIIEILLLVSVNLLAAHNLGPQQYGIFAIIFSSAQILSFLLIMEIHSAFVHYASHNKNHIISYQSAAILLFFCTAIIALSLFAIISHYVHGHYTLGENTFWMISITAFTIAFVRITRSFLNVNDLQHCKIYLRVLQASAIIIAFVLFFYYLKLQTFEALVIAYILGCAIFSILGFLIILIKHKFKFSTSKKFLINIVQYVQHGLIGMFSHFLTNNGDKIIVLLYFGLAETGTYMLYYVIATIIAIISARIFSQLRLNEGDSYNVRSILFGTLIVSTTSIVALAFSLSLCAESCTLYWSWVVLFGLYAGGLFWTTVFSLLSVKMSQWHYQQDARAHFYGLLIFISILLMSMTLELFTIQLIIIALIGSQLITGLMQRKSTAHIALDI